MIPLLSAEQLRQADAHTIAREPISSLDLMERAAERCTVRLLKLLARDVPVVVMAGMGNNGGDGLAIARIMHGAAQPVQVLVPRYKTQGSPDFEANLQRARDAGVSVVWLEDGSDLTSFMPGTVVVDALFGTGLQRPLAGWIKQLVHSLNARRCNVVSIDLPSGLFADDNTGNDPEAIVRAVRTLTLELPKHALLLAENHRFTGDWEVVDIGLDKAFIASFPSKAAVLEEADAVDRLPGRARVAHKGDHGHAWLLAGGPGKMGAALLAAKACLRSGCGLLTLRIPAGQEAVVHGHIPEAMVSSDPAGHLENMPRFGRVDAIGIGPGMGTDEGSGRLLKLLIQEAPAPLVVDADALNLLAANKTWLAFLPPGTILTPHPKELERLAGKAGSDQERLAQAVELARRHQVVVILKGAYTAICTPDGHTFFNTTGNPGMAKGGSGDALTGILTGLRAQGLGALDAAILGVYTHGLAGNIAAAELGMDGMLPGDLIAALPKAWCQLREKQEQRGS